MSNIIYNHSSFIENKYFDAYQKIINKYKELNLERSEDLYLENHHIIPDKLGGSNNPDNMVMLPYKAHFICHHLLTKFTKGKALYQMRHAFKFMGSSSKSHKHKRNLTARQYTILKENSRLIKHSEESKKKISNSMKGIHIGKNNPFYGKTHSEESKKKMRVAQKGRIYPKGKEHHSYGKTYSIAELEQRKKACPRGIKHHKCTGYYVTPFGKFLTRADIEKFLKSNKICLNARSVGFYCKNNPNITKKTYIAVKWLQDQFDENIIGKTFKDLGFYFEEVK